MTDVNQEDGAKPEVQRDADGFLIGNDTLTFTVPKDTVKEGATAGDEIEIPFTFRQVDSDELAQRIVTEKKWDLQELVNRKLKADARSNKYQGELLQHKPVTTKRTPDEIQESIFRDALRLGMSETAARAHVDAMIAALNK